MSINNRDNLFDDVADMLELGEFEKYGLYGFLMGFIFVFLSSGIASIVLFGTAVFFGVAGLASFFTDNEKAQRNYPRKIKEPEHIKPTISAPITDEPTIADRIKEIHIKNDFKCPSCGATVLPTDIK